jgi:hypothetical protein
MSHYNNFTAYYIVILDKLITWKIIRREKYKIIILGVLEYYILLNVREIVELGLGVENRRNNWGGNLKLFGWRFICIVLYIHMQW